MIGEDIDMEEKDTIVTLIDEENGQPVEFGQPLFVLE